MKKSFIMWFAILACAASLGFAQNVSSSLRATVLDSSAAAVPGAECILTNQGTGAALNTRSDSQGSCSFNIIPAGNYSFSAQAKGFKAIAIKDIAVEAGATRTLGSLTLEVGAMTETVQVTGEVSQINLATAEKAGTITMTQLQNVAVKGRDMFAYMMTIPGIVDNMSQGRETTSPDSLRGTFINGSRENAKNYSVDGITDLDTGSNNTLQFEPNMDSIAEVKVLTSNFQAEYGRNGGGVITVVTRGGGKDFHVAAYDTYRHESLNANSFWNNRQGTAKSPYRYRITGYNVGGPIYIPGKFNTKKEKLFFFWDQEYTGQRKDYGTRYVTMPTALERAGDFSKSVTGSGTLIKITDPTNPGVQFPGNIIPKSRFSTLGMAMINFLPMPNLHGSERRAGQQLKLPEFLCRRVSQTRGHGPHRLQRHAHHAGLLALHPGQRRTAGALRPVGERQRELLPDPDHLRRSWKGPRRTRDLEHYSDDGERVHLREESQ